MKRMYVLLMMFLCMQISAYVCRAMFILNDSPLADVGPTIEPEQIQEEFNATESVSRWSTFAGAISYIGDMVFGLFEMLGEIGVFIVAFPYFWTMIGAPAVWVVAMDALWLFVISWGVWEWISGREAQK